MDESSSWLATTLRKRAGGGHTAADVADAVEHLLAQLDDALCPVVGRRAVALLYLRALFLSAPAHPWLLAGERGSDQVLDFGPLRAVMQRQAADAALDGGIALLQNFYDLLCSLIGPSLTKQLLRRMWIASSGATPMQDIPR